MVSLSLCDEVCPVLPSFMYAGGRDVGVDRCSMIYPLKAAFFGLARLVTNGLGARCRRPVRSAENLRPGLLLLRLALYETLKGSAFTDAWNDVFLLGI
jgi:hypothetical protein